MPDVEYHWWVHSDYYKNSTETEMKCQVASKDGELIEQDCTGNSQSQSIVRKPLCQFGNFGLTLDTIKFYKFRTNV